MGAGLSAQKQPYLESSHPVNSLHHSLTHFLSSIYTVFQQLLGDTLVLDTLDAGNEYRKMVSMYDMII